MNGEVGVESSMDSGSRFWLILNEVNYDNDESRFTPGRG